jgi:hypothetical protein
VGFAGEFSLPAAGVGVGELRHPVGGLGNGEQVVGDCFCGGVVLQQEALFAALDVLRGCSVAEAEAAGLAGTVFVDDVEDAAEVEGPEAERVHFDGDNLAGLDLRFGIGDADPAEVEMAPLLHGCFCGFESGCALADLGAMAIHDIATRHLELLRAELGVERRGVVVGQGFGACDCGCDGCISRSARRKHVANKPPKKDVVLKAKAVRQDSSSANLLPPEREQSSRRN